MAYNPRGQEHSLPLGSWNNNIEDVLDEPKVLAAVLSLFFHVECKQIHIVLLSKLNDSYGELLVEVVLMIPEALHEGLEARHSEHAVDVLLPYLHLP